MINIPDRKMDTVWDIFSNVPQRQRLLMTLRYMVT